MAASVVEEATRLEAFPVAAEPDPECACAASTSPSRMWKPNSAQKAEHTGSLDLLPDCTVLLPCLGILPSGLLHEAKPFYKM